MCKKVICSHYGLDVVNVSFLSNTTKELPLVISPRWDNSLPFLMSWCEKNRLWIDEMILQYGAILIRGFEIHSPAEMEKVIRSYQPVLNDTYRGTSPRRLMEGTNFVFSAAEVPANYPIAQHIEMSFLDCPPKQLYFGCVKPSASAGGETALADFRKVYQDIPLDLKEKLLHKGVCYTRTHKKIGSYYTFDVSDMLGWPEMFGTSDKAEVERMCAAEGIPVKWEGPNHDTFVSTTQSHAFQLHPVTKELVWFNHTQVFHWTTFPAELFYAFKRTWDIRFLIHCIFISIFCVIKYGILGHKMSLNCAFGDGEKISVKEMSQIRTAIHKNMVFTRWENGDMIFIDNFSTSHGRQPTYDSSRKIVVAWANPVRKANEVKSLNPIQEQTAIKSDQCFNHQDCMPPSLISSPDLTPTKGEMNALREEYLSKLISEKMVQYNQEREHDIKQRHLHKKNYSEPPSFSVDSNFWQEDD
jgi:alpha-ketoglutarate-dependent taurine dioxygenase